MGRGAGERESGRKRWGRARGREEGVGRRRDGRGRDEEKREQVTGREKERRGEKGDLDNSVDISDAGSVKNNEGIRL